MQLPWWCCFPANLPRMLSRPSLCARRAAETGVSQLARTHGIHHTQHAQHAASSYGNHCRRRCCRWRPEKSAEEEVPFLLLRDCGCWCACAGARAGILGFAHATAGKEKKIPLTREKQQQKTPKSTKTPPKNNKNTKNTPKKHQAFFSHSRAKNKSQRNKKNPIPMAPPGPSNRGNSRSARCGRVCVSFIIINNAHTTVSQLRKSLALKRDVRANGASRSRK